MVDVVKEVQTPNGAVSIGGSYDPSFEAVFKEFEQNFSEREEVGAGVSITLEGATVVDLWGGLADAETRKPWTDKTMPIVWSSTKGATSICLHTLAYRGELDLDAPVSEYWPEYGIGDKASTTVKMFLDHTAGLPAIKEPVPASAFYDWPRIIRILEDAELWWSPGTEQGYHALTKGFLCGEIVRRVTGHTIGEFLQKEFSGPLGLDFFMGLPDDRMEDVATMIFPAQTDPPGDFFISVATDPEGIQSKVFTNDGGHMEQFQTEAALKSEIPAAGGLATARGLAGIYAPFACAGKSEGNRYIDEDQLRRMSSVSAACGRDKSLLVPMRFSEGFTKTMDNRRGKPGNQDSILMSEDAFGCPGFGGSIGLADPAAKMSFGYCMNNMGPGTALNHRGQGLLDGAYRSLGYRLDKFGRWCAS
ncbi:MAG: beta-lactamase family protein [Pseudomonadales bacterium]|nr:beta-lactamase family protein [Pseudomonadales bacterium]